MSILEDKELSMVVSNQGDYLNDLSKLENVKLIKKATVDMVILDTSDDGIMLLRLLSRHMCVAPVCKEGLYGEKLLELWGEANNILKFRRTVHRLYRLISPNGRARDSINWIRAKSQEGLNRRRRKDNRGDFKFKHLYWNTRKCIIEYLAANPTNTRRAEYLYSLYLSVSKLRKLDKAKWTPPMADLADGYFYTSRRFTVKRILRY